MTNSTFKKILVLSLAALLIISSSIAAALLLSPSYSPPDSSAVAAVGAASSFGKFSNGSKYYYSTSSTSTSETAVTVNSSAAWGAQTNPYVISTINQWVLFVNQITANNSTYNGKYYVLDADLNFSGNSIASVGNTSNGFTGTLYGNKHIISNVTVTSTTNYGGLFTVIKGGKIYDLTIDSNCTFNYTPNKTFYAGSLAGYAGDGSTIVNVHSTANVTASNAGLTSYSYLALGGLVGQSSGTLSFYKCSYKGTLKQTNIASSATACGNDNGSLGGFIGRAGSTTLTVAGCSAATTFNQYGGDVHTGGLWGFGAGMVYNISYTIVNFVGRTLSGPVGQNELGALGHDWGRTARPTNCSLSNVYIRTNGLTLTNSALVWSYANSTGNAVPPSSCTTVVADQTVTGVTTNNSAPITAAASNSTLGNIYTISGTTATNKLNSTFKISFIKGAGATGGPSDTTYSYSASAQNKTSLASPSRTGYTFAGWSLVSPSGTLSNSTKTTLTIPAAKRGNIRKKKEKKEKKEKKVAV